MRRCCLLLLMFTLSLCAGVSAQTDSAWPIVERCFGDATPPPDGWKFDGTLLMTGHYGLHGYRQDWDIPHVLVFYQSQIPYSGVLSPDGRWYAVIAGERGEIGFYASFTTHALYVYSTIDDEKYTVAWENGFYAGNSLTGHGLYWLDDKYLLYSLGSGESEEWFRINPFSGEINEWNSPYPFIPSWDDFRFSPDRQKALYRYMLGSDAFNWHLYNGTDEILLSLLEIAAWMPDSSNFVVYTLKTSSYPATPDQVALLDLNGNIRGIIFNAPENSTITYQWGLGWSPDGRYLLFGINRNLYLADMTEREVIDTCVSWLEFSPTVVWSPSATQFALIGSGQPERSIQIFDLQTWGRYVVGYHSGEIIGWRAD